MAGKEVIFLHESPNNVIFRRQYLRYIGLLIYKVNSQVITGLWRKTIRMAKDYANSDDNSFLIDEEVDNGCEIDNNFSLENQLLIKLISNGSS